MRYIYIIIAILASLDLSAQEAARRLDDIKSKFSSASGYKVEFLSSLEGEFYDMEGSIIIDKEGRYTMDLGSTIVIYDGDSQYNYIPSREEVTIERPSNNQGYLTNPAQLFAMDSNDFNITSDSETVDGKSYSALRLTPKRSSGGAAEQISLYLDGSNNIKMIVATLESGQHFTLKIQKLTLPYSVDDNIFKFSKSKYKGIEIIDMR